MGHPSEGELQALLDGEMRGVEGDSLRAHLRACGSCRRRAEAQQTAAARVSSALSLLDQQPSMVPEEVRRRLETRLRTPGEARGAAGWRRAGREARPSRGVIPFPLLRSHRTLPLPWAASIALLLTAGAASALPGSPVRGWLAQGWAMLTDSGPAPGETVPVAPVPEDPPGLPEAPVAAEIGASILPGDQGVELWISGLPAGADLRVVWVDGDMAGIFAGEGTRFRTEPGRVEAEAPPGPVRVEIPRGLGRVVVGVDGSVVMRVSGGEVDIPGPVQRRTPVEIILRPGRS